MICPCYGNSCHDRKVNESKDYVTRIPIKTKIVFNDTPSVSVFSSISAREHCFGHNNVNLINFIKIESSSIEVELELELDATEFSHFCDSICLGMFIGLGVTVTFSLTVLIRVSACLTVHVLCQADLNFQN